MTTIPVDAIDPAAAHDRWVHEYEWHLDLVPPIMDALITATLPSIRANRTDKIIVTGGGPVDNMTAFLRGIDVATDGRLVDGGAAADALTLWWDFVDYLQAATAWINLDVAVPIAPDLPPLAGDFRAWVSRRPDPDPLIARRVAFASIAWLIDHAGQVAAFEQLEESREGLFAEVRRMRSRYGVMPHTRRPRAVCTTCGERAVTVTWIDNPNGSVKPIRAGKCRRCGEQYLDTTEPVQRPHTAPNVVLSTPCSELLHEACRSVHCACRCHEGEPS